MFYDDSTQCVKMMKQNSVCLRLYWGIHITRVYTLQFITKGWKMRRENYIINGLLCVCTMEALCLLWTLTRDKLDLLADWVILFADFTSKYQCELLTFWEASSNTPHCVLSGNPKNPLKFGLAKLGGVSFFNPPPDIWLSDETLLNVIHFSVFENKWNTR